VVPAGQAKQGVPRSSKAHISFSGRSLCPVLSSLLLRVSRPAALTEAVQQQQAACRGRLVGGQAVYNHSAYMLGKQTCRTAKTPALGLGWTMLVATSPVANTSGGPPADCRNSLISRKPEGSAAATSSSKMQCRARRHNPQQVSEHNSTAI
jgi:hypothetical protein